MPKQFLKLTLQPGVVKDTTRYANMGGYWDSDYVRFRNGMPETMGGWQQHNSEAMGGVPRSIFPTFTLSQDLFTIFGTSNRLYIEQGGALTDITPIRDTSSGVSDPFTTTALSDIVTVVDTGSATTMGDLVLIEGATGFDGLAAGDLNGVREVVSTIDVNTYTIQAGAAATAGATGGGTVDFSYYVSTGASSAVIGNGWGSMPWGGGSTTGWGEGASASAAAAGTRLWFHDNWGEDVVSNIRNAGIYYWDATNPFDRAVPLGDVSTDPECPVIATKVLVSKRDRHMVVFGSNDLGAPDQVPLLIRWSDAENLNDWTTGTTDTAGSYNLSAGTKIVTALETRSEILVWTDTSLYAMRYIGGNLVFGFDLMSRQASILGPNAMITANDVVYWMGNGSFYQYNGQVDELPCPMVDYIFSNISPGALDIVACGTNMSQGEIFWFYPSADAESGGNDRYVVYNYKEEVWYVGSMARTAWVDVGVNQYPVATTFDGWAYDQEFGHNDGSTNPPVPMTPYIESSPIEIGDGVNYLFITRILHDLTFRNSQGPSPSAEPVANFTIATYDYPGGALAQDDVVDSTRVTRIPIETFTEQSWIRLRGRSVVFRMESSTLNTAWRMGAPRLEVRTDGRK